MDRAADAKAMAKSGGISEEPEELYSHFEAVRTQDVSGGAALDDLQFIDCAPRKCSFFHSR